MTYWGLQKSQKKSWFLAKYVKSWTFHVKSWTFRDRGRTRKPAQRKGLRTISGCAVNSIYKHHEKDFRGGKNFRPPKSLKKKKKLVIKNHSVEQTTNGLRCDKFTEPISQKQNRPTQPRYNLQVTVTTQGKGISILYIRNLYGECGWYETKLLEKGNRAAEIIYPFGKRISTRHNIPLRYRCRRRDTEPYWLSVAESHTLPPIMRRGGTGVGKCIG